MSSEQAYFLLGAASATAAMFIVGLIIMALSDLRLRRAERRLGITIPNRRDFEALRREVIERARQQSKEHDTVGTGRWELDG